MDDAFIKQFLAAFDDTYYPLDFLNDYEVLECLAHNEMGETLLVKERRTGETYICKCYAKQALLSNSNESRLLKNLNHAGLPFFIGEYENENMRCILRTYLQGTPLDELVRTRRLNRNEALDIVLQLCDILIYLHGQTPPIIHRDIKPQNIIVDEAGRVSLIDFGISRYYNADSQGDTLNFGTRHYAAPEQYGFSQTDARADIFSLGVLLCWLLTGTLDVQQGIQSVNDAGLARLISRCTAFAPKDRYKNVMQVKDALNGRTTRRFFLFGIAAFVLLLAAAWLGYGKFVELQGPPAVQFKEALVEEAVRLSLGKTADEKISEKDLKSVSQLYIFGDKAAAGPDDFNVYSKSFAEGHSLAARGDIQSLEDLPRMPNLVHISLVYQNITDLSPLAQMGSLESVDMRHNPFSDISALAKVSRLKDLGIFDTRVSDLTALKDNKHLVVLDIGLTDVESAAALNGLDTLKLFYARKAPLKSLDGIDTHPLLEEIALSETFVQDLTPLLNLPHLKKVEISEDMRPAASSVQGQASFNIVYQ
ncbi:MAG: protein kinase [Anaerolineae bacterium]|nr:protein kinase [Anaerolineae bacterium]